MENVPPRVPDRSVDALRHFRAPRPRTPLHPLEKLLLVLVAAQLVLLPWMLGGMRVTGQYTSLGLAVAALLVSLLPRHYNRLLTGQDAFTLYPVRRLIRFPLFWLGLGFLGYVLIQALNPAWSYRSEGNRWWLVRLPNISWLPAGMETPFAQSNPWRSLMIYASAWLPVCAVWIGFTRRSTLRHLFTILAVNGALLAGLGMVQRFEGNGKILWFVDVPASYFVSTFIYKNHAAAYFNLALAVAVGLAFWHLVQGQRRLQKSSPAALFTFCAVMIALIVLFSFSRTGTLLMAAYLVLVTGLLVWHKFRAPAGHRNLVATGIVLLLLAGFAGYGVYSLKLDQVVVRFEELRNELASEKPDSRQLARQATWDMARDRPVTGWGAGSFRHYFPMYQRVYAPIYDNGKLRWEHAHNDYLQTLAEVGSVGAGLIVLMLGSGAWGLYRGRCWRNPLALFGVAGLLVTLAHAWIDFQFQNPAILTTWAVLLWGFVRWTELDR